MSLQFVVVDRPQGLTICLSFEKEYSVNKNTTQGLTLRFQASAPKRSFDKN